jgi:hypothetical protein
MRKPTKETVYTNFRLDRKTSEIIDQYCDICTKFNGKRMRKGDVMQELVTLSVGVLAKRISKIESQVKK